jgi:hypothetical protein
LHTIDNISKKLKVSVFTIKNWYYFCRSKYNKNNLIFPEPLRDGKGRMLFSLNQIKEIKIFKDNLEFGQMAEFNRRYRRKK